MNAIRHQPAVIIEAGAKRTFAGVVDWPDESRNGRGEEAATVEVIERLRGPSSSRQMIHF